MLFRSNLTWQNPEQLFVAQELINKVKSKCCGIKVNVKKIMIMKKILSLLVLAIVAVQFSLCPLVLRRFSKSLKANVSGPSG